MLYDAVSLMCVCFCAHVHQSPLSAAFCVVYATMRNLAKKKRLLESVKGLHKDTLDILQMDVTSQQSIQEAKDMVVEKRVDILGTCLCWYFLIYAVTCVCVSEWPCFHYLQCVTPGWV